MNTITATTARSNLFQLFKKTIHNHIPIRISSKAGAVVLLSEEYYDSLIETAELLSQHGFRASIAQANEEIKNGEVFSISDVFDE